MTVKLTFDGRVFVPDQAPDVPAGTVVEVELPAQESAEAGRAVEGKHKTFKDLIEILKEYPSDPDAPTDGAAQVDHYLYGTPKRP